MHYIILGIILSFTFSFIKKKRAKKFHRQLELFKSLGFELNDGVSEKDILRWENGKSDFENEPYSLLYLTLGQSIEKEPWTSITNQCWDFDTECIEDHGAYVEIFKNLSRISNGHLQFDNIKDFVDIDNKIAWIEFSISNKDYKWNLKVDDDWVDPSLFSKISDLTKIACPNYGFTYYNTGGQNAVIGFESKKSFKKFKKKTDLEIEWIK